MLQPQRRKFRKQMTPYLHGISKWWNNVSFWEYWIKAMENWFISNRQLEAVRKVIVRRVRKIWKIRIRVFPDTPITKGWLEMPMWKWKWEVDKFVARVKRWKIIFEIWWVSEEMAIECFEKSLHKLPIKVRLVKKWEIR